LGSQNPGFGRLNRATSETAPTHPRAAAHDDARAAHLRASLKYSAALNVPPDAVGTLHAAARPVLAAKPCRAGR
jgi:hypothetical protein